MKAEIRQDLVECNVVFIHSTLDDMGLPAATFRVYAHLARRANGGLAYPGIDSMAKVCRLAKNTVIESIRQLEACRMVEATRISGQRTQYVLSRPSLWQPFDTVANQVTVKPPEASQTEERPVANEVTLPSQTEERKVIHSKVIQKGDPIPPADASPAVANLNGNVTSEHATFIADWCLYYGKRFPGKKYPFGGRDAKAVKTLLTHFGGIQPAKEFIKACHLRTKEGFPFGMCETLPDIANNIGRLQSALATPARANGRPQPPATAGLRASELPRIE